MERIIEHKGVTGDTFGYDRAFTVTKVQSVVGMAPAKVPEAVNVNPLKAVEDAVEQNDNSFDGIINNLPPVANNEMSSANPSYSRETERESVLEQLHMQTQQALQVQVMQAQLPRIEPQQGQDEKVM